MMVFHCITDFYTKDRWGENRQSSAVPHNLIRIVDCETVGIKLKYHPKPSQTFFVDF